VLFGVMFGVCLVSVVWCVFGVCCLVCVVWCVCVFLGVCLVCLVRLVVWCVVWCVLVYYYSCYYFFFCVFFLSSLLFWWMLCGVFGDWCFAEFPLCSVRAVCLFVWNVLDLIISLPSDHAKNLSNLECRVCGAAFQTVTNRLFFLLFSSSFSN